MRSDSVRVELGLVVDAGCWAPGSELLNQVESPPSETMMSSNPHREDSDLPPDKPGPTPESSPTQPTPLKGSTAASQPSGGLGWSNFCHAAIYRQLDGILDRWYGRLKHALLWPVSGQVLEIGAGTGINFSYYRPGMQVTAVEPNRWMHGRLKQRAREHQLRLEILGTGAERLPLPDQSFSHVTGTLVLCTVKSPSRVLAEIFRVLRPGGRFTFIEHVADRGWRLRFQQVAYWPWYWMAGGCCLTRNPLELIRAAGFEAIDVQDHRVGPAWLPMRAHLVGSATKPLD